MSRASVTLYTYVDRMKVAAWARKAPEGTRVEFKQAKRTLDQNSKLWAMLTDVAQQVEWHGMKLRTGEWKFLFLDALSRERRLVPNIDGDGFVPLYKSTSDLSKGEMSDLIELIGAFGARHGVVFKDRDNEKAQNIAAA